MSAKRSHVLDSRPADTSANPAEPAIQGRQPECMEN